MALQTCKDGLSALHHSTIAIALLLPFLALAARQPYDVRKIIQALKEPHDDLKLLCAHRGLRFNGTTENSRDAYFRASEAGLEGIETDIRLSADGKLPVLRDEFLGRTTDIGEATNNSAYNPYTGLGHNPPLKEMNFINGIEELHLRDKQGRVHIERVPTLPEMVQSIHDSGMDVVLELDFKDQAAIEPSYWALKNLTNAAGVPENEWCIYKLQSIWHQNVTAFESLPWVQDAFTSGIQLAYIPVFNPSESEVYDQLDTWQQFSKTNYTLSAEVEINNYGSNATLQGMPDYIQSCDRSRTAGIYYSPGDFTYPNTDDITFFDTGNFSLPEDLKVNGSVWGFSANGFPNLNEGDTRSNWTWIIEEKDFDWIITDTADEWAARLAEQGLRNLMRLVQDGATLVEDGRTKGWYRKRHVRDFGLGR